MSKSTLPRLKALRDEMGKAGITAFIIPGTDPHQSEYYASHWAARTWISGFDGSAGTAVVTTNQAGLWTDSRYFLQAAQQLEDSGFELFKEGLPDTPTIEQWLLTTLPQGATIAIDGTLFGASKAAAMKQNFESHGFRFVSDFTPFDSIWEKRPSIPKNEAFIHDEKYSGESISDKMARIMEQVRQAGAAALLLAALDEIAWAFNIRGTDVECNPVVICYAYIDDSRRILFIDKAKINDTVCQYLQKNSVEIMPYENIFDFVAALPAEKKVFVDTNKINYTLLNKLHAIPVSGQSPIALLKSIKNETQLAGTREAMIRDGVALVRFFRWLEKKYRQRQSNRNNSCRETARVPLATKSLCRRKFRHYRRIQRAWGHCPLLGYTRKQCDHFSQGISAHRLRGAISRRNYRHHSHRIVRQSVSSPKTRLHTGNERAHRSRHLPLSTRYARSPTRCPRPPFPMGRSPQLLARDWSRSRAFPQCPRGTAKHTPRRKSHASHAGHDYL